MAAGSAVASPCQDQVLCMWWSFALIVEDAACAKHKAHRGWQGFRSCQIVAIYPKHLL